MLRLGVDGNENPVAVDAAEYGMSEYDEYARDGRRLSCADCGGVSQPPHCNAVAALGIDALVSIYGTETPRGCR